MFINDCTITYGILMVPYHQRRQILISREYKNWWLLVEVNIAI